MKFELLIDLLRNDNTLHSSIDFFKNNKATCRSQGELVNSLCEVLKILNGDSERISVNLKAYCKNTAGSLSSLSEKIKKRNDFQNDKLSVRELEVLDLIMQGYTNKEISEMLYLSHETIRSHRKNILRKTRQKNTASLINYYHQTFFDK